MGESITARQAFDDTLGLATQGIAEALTDSDRYSLGDARQADARLHLSGESD